MKKLSEITKKALQPIIQEQSVFEEKLKFDWPNIVGDEIALISYPQAVKFGNVGNKEAVLILAVNPAHILDIQYSEAIIKDRIAVYFGFQAIHRIKLVSLVFNHGNDITK
jgi:hypothetical protein